MSFPKVLYKYRNFNDFTLMSLINQSAWFSGAKQLNDPFDCQLTFDKYVPSKDQFLEKVELARKELSKKLGKPVTLNLPPECFDGDQLSEVYCRNIDDFRSQIESHASRVGVLSLSENGDNTTMWSHYGSSHSGLCIGYNMEVLAKRYPLQKLLHKVNYEPALEISFNPFDKYAECCCGNDQYGYKKVATEMLTVKSDDWKYESEWRIINGGIGNFDLGNEAIESIYFGLKSTVDMKITVSNILKAFPVNFYQMVRSGSGLAVEPEFMNESSKYWTQEAE
ncbi:DUF2971 domain-containing protein [Vibrio maritimus]|uniref:DUF2971 domain-containing protein n=1 Tax=Vibrio maritimus TaxID=990268 RepID=UPI003735F4F4